MPKIVVEAQIVRNTEIGVNVKELVLYAPEIAAQAVAGQFIHARVADSYHPLLRRPLSISSTDSMAGTVSTIYRVVGQGTACLASLSSKDSVDCMGPLGRGFTIHDGQRPLLVGGGMGLAPLVFLAGALCPRPIEILMGGRTKEEMFWTDLFHNKCDTIHVTTDDGSLGSCGVTLDVLPDLLKCGTFDMIYTCGPRIMMEGVAKLAKEYNIPCQVSLEDYMACGIGGCLSCTCASTDGTRKKVCTDGPVFWAQEVMS